MDKRKLEANEGWIEATLLEEDLIELGCLAGYFQLTRAEIAELADKFPLKKNLGLAVRSVTVEEC